MSDLAAILILGTVRFRATAGIALLGGQIAIGEANAGCRGAIRDVHALAVLTHVAGATGLITPAAVEWVVVGVDAARAAISPVNIAPETVRAAPVAARRSPCVTISAARGVTAASTGIRIASGTQPIPATGVAGLTGVVWITKATGYGARAAMAAAARAPGNEDCSERSSAQPVNDFRVTKFGHKEAPTS